MSDKIRIAVLVSGGGTNLQALIDAQAEKALAVLKEQGEDAYVIGEIVAGGEKIELL